MGLRPPAHDVLCGQLVAMEADARRAVLVIGAPSAPVPGSTVAYSSIYTGELVIAYGLALLYELDFLLPQWVYDDFRREYHAADALAFLMRRGDAFPRADVAGRRVSTGQRADLFLKQLDLARGVQAFAYASLDAHEPLARLVAALWVDASASGWLALAEDDTRAPHWLRQAVPCAVVSPAGLPDRLAALAGG